MRTYVPSPLGSGSDNARREKRGSRTPPSPYPFLRVENTCEFASCFFHQFHSVAHPDESSNSSSMSRLRIRMQPWDADCQWSGGIRTLNAIAFVVQAHPSRS